MGVRRSPAAEETTLTIEPLRRRRRMNTLHYNKAVLYQVLNKQVPVPVPVPVPVVQVPVQVPVPNLQVPVPVQVLCINYRRSVTLQLHKVKVVVSFILKKNEQLEPMNFKHKSVTTVFFWFWLASC